MSEEIFLTVLLLATVLLGALQCYSTGYRNGRHDGFIEGQDQESSPQPGGPT